MKYIGFLFILLTLSCQPSKPKSLLIYTRNGEGFVHDNIEASVEALEKLASENNYEVQVTDSPDFFTPENLKQIDCIIFSNSNNEAFTSQDQRDAFKHYIESGGGFVGIHSASGSE
ncbi:MAG: ThuA domain-containing protein, partial [Cytophagia bacterium]|nr:ThuA domain-containing protein [Cytophagia bacterium]